MGDPVGDLELAGSEAAAGAGFEGQGRLKLSKAALSRVAWRRRAS